MNAYTILKTIHVLAAVVWVGGAVTTNVVGTRALRSERTHQLAVVRDIEWLGGRVYVPSSLIVLLFGILTALNAHDSFARAWLIVGLVGIGFTALTGSLYLTPELRRIGAIAGQRGLDHPEARRRLTRLVRIARIDLVVLIVVIIDMVLKPGA